MPIVSDKLQFTQDQVLAIDAIIQFVKDRKTLLTVGGLAGVGKTVTLSQSIYELRRMPQFKNLRVAFVAFTGKAAVVLRDKLQKAAALGQEDHCGTIHSLIYEPVTENGRIVMWRKVDSIPYDIIALDEASMVGDTIFDDLKSYGVPIIAVGDHGQLPPVQSKYNLMENPMVKLEKIHRQAEGNPIIKVSMMARNGEDIPFGRVIGKNGEYVNKTKEPYMNFIRASNREHIKSWMILCAINRLRVSMNKEIRGFLGYRGDPQIGEKVICLKNSRKEGIFNGMTGEATSCMPLKNEDFYALGVKFDLLNFDWYGDVFRHQFNCAATLHEFESGDIKYTAMEMKNLFDFAYVITTHKSQGSQSSTVMVLEHQLSWMPPDHVRRWRYTSYTRAEKNLIIIGKEPK